MRLQRGQPAACQGVVFRHRIDQETITLRSNSFHIPVWNLISWSYRVLNLTPGQFCQEETKELPNIRGGGPSAARPYRTPHISSEKLSMTGYFCSKSLK